MSAERSSSSAGERRWRFAIDVGGTFTDVVATSPDGATHVHKLLSTGRVRGLVGTDSRGSQIVDPQRVNDPPDFWTGYQLTLLDAASSSFSTQVDGFDSSSGLLRLRDPIPQNAITRSYELHSHEPAPIVAIRYLMGLRLDDPIGAIELRLGTTRATNALLERKGACVALVTTRGFADFLKIGHQDRPKLFELNIRKREELAETVIEIDERITANGQVLRAPDRETIRRQLEDLRKQNIESLAICLLHAHTNPQHEELVAEIADSVGFRHVSVSHRVSRREGFVSRGDTTVVDAYLSPVITDYVASLRKSLPDARILLMTSNGGLVQGERVSGKDTVLSGPAGGVVGCAHVASDLGFEKSIGFDMGGTSTDVCRIDGPFEFQNETVKAGVRMLTPMLAVETVAAGGGSICGFDGHHLFVGPKSAGADPGPACYGRGGPLTITDVNVLLGRLVPSCFPFKLDVETAQSRLNSILAEVNGATGSKLTAIELAEGFQRIANEKMAAAIRQVSTSKGYDVREYTLVSFGGAGGQHACAIADTLGINSIIHSPFAGVLSAVGIGTAAITRIAERSTSFHWYEKDSEPLLELIDELTGEAINKLEEDGVDPSAISTPENSFDVCYAGQSSFIALAGDPWATLPDRFADAHRKLYGYAHANRAIEIRAVRVKVQAIVTRRAGEVRSATDRHEEANSARTEKMILNGTPHNVPVLRRNDLVSGKSIVGPAIVAEETSTFVIDNGWSAKVADDGSLVLARSTQDRRESRASTEFDPVQLELFRSRFSAIAERMGTTLRRTALSTNVKDRLDFSCAVFTIDGELIANAPHIPVHLGGMSHCAKALMQDVGGFRRGDIYITNDPFRGGSHLNDVTVVTPVFGDRDELLFVVASRAHHAEIGGKRPGSMAPDSTSLAEEGVLIRAFKYMDRGHPQVDAFRKLLTTAPYPTRAPEENLADVAAQVAANETGAQDLRSLIASQSRETVDAYVRYMRESAARQVRAAIARLPQGVRRFEDSLDDGTRICLALTIANETATFDFTGTSPVHRGNFNANVAIVTSAVLYCLRCLIDEDIPLNAGVLDAVRIIVPDSFLNPTPDSDPLRCPAVGAGNVESSQRIVDTIFGALGVVAASQGTMNNLLMGNARFGYYETICGGSGAGPDFNGCDAVHTHMTNTRLTDVEILESRYPVRVARFGIRYGSGGAGKNRGGGGVVREIEFLEPLSVSIISQRRTRGPYGVNDGENGAPGRNSLRRRDSTTPEILPSVVQFDAVAGDRLTIETPGGGGFGQA